MHSPAHKTSIEYWLLFLLAHLYTQWKKTLIVGFQELKKQRSSRDQKAGVLWNFSSKLVIFSLSVTRSAIISRILAKHSKNITIIAFKRIFSDFPMKKKLILACKNYCKLSKSRFKEFLGCSKLGSRFQNRCFYGTFLTFTFIF